MCGIVGVTSALPLAEPAKKAFYDMLHFDVVRGEDSTGVAAISKSQQGQIVEVFKSVGPTSDFFLEHRKGWKSYDFSSHFPHTFIGHNRFATRGKITLENAHPFEFDNLVGVHNGTVDMYSLRKFDGYKNYEVDSQIIYSHLNNHTIDDVWSQADGAAALVWWDKRDSTLRMIRHQRPLSVVYSEDDKLVFWASEVGMIYMAASRNNIKLKAPVEMPPNRLFTFGHSADYRMHHEERDLPPFVKRAVVQHYGNTGYYRGWEDWDNEVWVPPKPKNKKGDQSNPIIMGPNNPPAKLLAPVKEDNKTNMLIITEYHDIKHNPCAFGYTQDGTLVRVNIPFDSSKDVKNKIIGRQGQGYYIAPRLCNSAVDPKSLWVQWEKLTWCKFKDGHYIIRGEDKAWEIQKVIELDESTSLQTATCFDPKVKYLRGAWQNRVSCGCMNCFNIPKWDEADTLKWIDEENFFCQNCAELPLIKDGLNQLRSA